MNLREQRAKESLDLDVKISNQVLVRVSLLKYLRCSLDER